MISTVLALAGIMVLNFENDLQKCAHHVSYDIYQRIFIFDHHRYHNHFVQRVDWIYHFRRLKKKKRNNSLKKFVLNVFPVLNFRRSLLNNFFFNLIIQMQTESATDRLDVPTDVLDVPTDLVKRKSGGQLTRAPLATLMVTTQYPSKNTDLENLLGWWIAIQYFKQTNGSDQSKFAVYKHVCLV